MAETSPPVESDSLPLHQAKAPLPCAPAAPCVPVPIRALHTWHHPYASLLGIPHRS
jgi:hypothetical protein